MRLTTCLLFLGLLCVDAPKAFSSDNFQDRSGLRGNGMGFTPNEGQIIDVNGNLRPDILFQGDGNGTSYYLKENGFSYVLKEFTEVPSPLDPMDKFVPDSELKPKDLSVKFHRVDVEFIGSNSKPKIEEEFPVEGITHYYYPHCKEGITNVRSHNQVRYNGVYEGVDVIYYGNKQSGIKYDIVVQPGANPNLIKLKYSGANNIELITSHMNGGLRIETSLQTIYENMPKVYQLIDEEVIDIKAEYTLNENIVGFKLGNYNKHYPLIIDPWITNYGGSNWDRCGSIATDNTGAVSSTGNTFSTNFPVLGASQPAHGGGSWDGFVVKFDVNGTRVFGSYFGGDQYDFTNGVHTDNANNIYFTGGTNSQNLPVTNPGGGAYFQGAYAGGAGLATGEAFLVKMTPAGVITWLTYIGGSDQEEGLDIRIAPNGDIALVGYTQSTNFPTVTPWQAVNNLSPRDAFIMKMNSAGAIQWSTYYGGNATETCNSVDFDPNGDICIAGITVSTNFPVLAAHQGIIGPGGSADGFVAKLNGGTGAPIWSTYYGDNGFGGDILEAIVVDGLGNVYVGGRTSSAANIATPGSFQPTKQGSYDAMIIKFNNAGVRQWATYVGGSAGLQEYVTGLAIDNDNNLVVGGDTYCSDFPVTSCAYQTTFASNECQFYMVFYPNGENMCSGMIGISGGGDKETWQGRGGSLDVFGCNMYMNTMSNCKYPTTPGCFQSSCGGGLDLSILQLYIYTCGGTDSALADFNGAPTTICPGKSVSYSVNYSACDTADITYLWSFPGGTPGTSTLANPNITYLNAGNFDAEVIVTNHCRMDTIIKTNYVNVTPSFTTSINPTNLTCNGQTTGSATVTHGGGAGFTYYWSNTQTTNTISNLSGGVYTVTVNDGTGCISTNTVTITEPAAISTTITSTDASCGGNNGTASVNPSGGTGAYTYSWNNGQSTQTATNLSGGTYTVTITDNNGCTQQSTVNVNALGGGTVTPTSTSVLCNGGANGTASASVAGGTSPYTYQWTGGQTTQNISGLPSGVYNFTITDASGCIFIDSVTVTEPAPMNMNSNVVDDICNGSVGSITVNPSGGTGPYTYSWNTGLTMQTITGLVAGSYSVTITDANGCTFQASSTIGNTGGGTLLVTGTNSLCNGDNNGTATATIAGGSTPYTYSWNTGGTTQAISGLAPGTYTVVVTDNSGCSNIDTVVVNEPDPISLGITFNDSICEGTTSNFTATVNGGSPAYLYSWSNGSTSANISVSPTSNTSYSLTIADSYGCSKDTSILLSVVPAGAEAGPNINIIQGQTSTLSASGTGTYSWQPTTSCTCPNPIVTPSITTTYTLTIDNNGCIAYDTVTVFVEPVECEEGELHVPTAFSPNGDGENDELKFFVTGFPEVVYFAIYSRWGEKVFETTDLNATWDGTYKGKQMGTAVFSYILKVNCSAANIGKIKTGSVSLLR